MEAVCSSKTQRNLFHCYKTSNLGRKNPNKWKVLIKENITAKTQS
jgi:hypothetical protein